MAYPNPAQDPLNRPSSPEIAWLFSKRPHTAELILALPIEIRDLIWNSLFSPQIDYLTWWARQKRNWPLYKPKDYWSHCTDCWVAQMSSIPEHPVLALLQVNKSINNEIERWLCSKFKSVAFCTDACFWEYLSIWRARGPLRRTNDISLRLEDVSESITKWEVHAILVELGKTNRTGVGVGRGKGSGEWEVVRKSQSRFKKIESSSQSWEVVLRRGEI